MGSRVRHARARHKRTRSSIVRRNVMRNVYGTVIASKKSDVPRGVSKLNSARKGKKMSPDVTSATLIILLGSTAIFLLWLFLSLVVIFNVINVIARSLIRIPSAARSFRIKKISLAPAIALYARAPCRGRDRTVIVASDRGLCYLFGKFG